MFLLQSLTPPGHEVLLIDGNARPMNEAQIAQYVRDEKIDLVGIGAMTRMIAKAYRIADAIRATGVKVVMGGPHVTELADEALGRDGGPRHADAVALGEADETWPQMVNDAARGELKEIYVPVDDTGKERKPSLKQYPVIPWESIDLEQFNLVPKAATAMLEKVGEGWGTVSYTHLDVYKRQRPICTATCLYTPRIVNPRQVAPQNAACRMLSANACQRKKYSANRSTNPTPPAAIQMTSPACLRTGATYSRKPKAIGASTISENCEPTAIASEIPSSTMRRQFHSTCLLYTSRCV